MKDISHKKLLILNKQQEKCKNFNNNFCTAKQCICNLKAEIWSYIYEVIPEQYAHHTIQDFTGFYKGTQVLKAEIVKKAREQIINYCWKDISPGEDYDFNSWSERSVISNRLVNGNSLVIYGNSWTNNQKFERKKTGKTLIASIVMKEAIFQRINPINATEHYEWVDYLVLVKRLMEHAKKDNFDDLIHSYQTSEWLVIDNIDTLNNTEYAKQFSNSVLDSLLAERKDKGLPTIFVFQDDISKNNLLHEEFGYVLNSIVNNKKTYHVNLT